MKYKLLLIALLFSVGGYGQAVVTTLEHAIPPDLIGGVWNQPTEFTNAPAIVETGTCVYLNRNDKIQIAKQATRTTYTEYMEDGPLLIASQEITYKTKYGINIPEDAVILFKIKPKK